ncbi:hypothetical protein TIFTF001_000604 [Ficus carica]|uniref:Uncharacterized protein n=1 Tax=Ficus carica TaxID=3494 RepID=A0AA88CK99_FICCA|nr:hypothetical protein TIFTF001_000604 [Ficus carica]
METSLLPQPSTDEGAALPDVDDGPKSAPPVLDVDDEPTRPPPPPKHQICAPSLPTPTKTPSPNQICAAPFSPHDASDELPPTKQIYAPPPPPLPKYQPKNR